MHAASANDESDQKLLSFFFLISVLIKQYKNDTKYTLSLQILKTKKCNRHFIRICYYKRIFVLIAYFFPYLTVEKSISSNTLYKNYFKK